MFKSYHLPEYQPVYVLGITAVLGPFQVWKLQNIHWSICVGLLVQVIYTSSSSMLLRCLFGAPTREGISVLHMGHTQRTSSHFNRHLQCRNNNMRVSTSVSRLFSLSYVIHHFLIFQCMLFYIYHQ